MTLVIRTDEKARPGLVREVMDRQGRFGHRG